MTKIYYLSFYLHLLISPVVSFGHYIICPSIYSLFLPLWYLLVILLPFLLFTASYYPCGTFWSLYCLSFYLQLLIIPVVSFGHYITCPSIYSFLFPLWYLLVTILHVLLFTASYYPCGIFWHYITCPSIYSFLLPMWYLLVIILPVLLFTASYYPCDIVWSLYCLFFYFQLLITPVVSFGHYIACPSIYSFLLPLWLEGQVI
jgi:hypothetical protein